MAEHPPLLRRRWPLLLGGAGVAAAAVGLGILAWVQSAAGFQAVVLPAVARATGWTLAADWGRLGLDGRVEAREVSFDLPAAGLSGRIGHLQLSVEATSLLGPGVPHLRQVVARDAVLRWSSAPASEDEAAPELSIPVVVDHLVVLGGVVRVVRGERTAATLHGVTARVADLRPGAEAAAELIANVRAAPDRPRAATDAAARLTLALPQSEDGLSWSWVGAGEARVRATSPDAVLRQEVAFALATEGAMTPGPILAGSLDLRASRGDAPLGTVEGEARWEGGDAGGLDATVVLADLGPGFLNPLLALVAPVQLQGGQVDGRLEAGTEAGEVGWTAEVTGADVVLAPTDGGAPTAPVRVVSRQSGTLAWDGSALTVSEATLGVDAGGRRILGATLSEPMTLLFGERDGDAPPTARLAVTFDKAPLRDLRAWLALSGSDPLAQVAQGTLDASWLAAVEDGGDTIRISGTWTATDVTTTGPDPWGPLTVRHDLDLSVAERARFEVAARSARVTWGGRPFATLAPRVSYDRSTGALGADGSVQADDAPAVLRRLGFLPAWADLREGRLSGVLGAGCPATGRPLALTADLQTTAVRLVASDGATAGRHRFGIKVHASRDAAGTEWTLSDTTVTVLDQGTQPGLVVVSGHWPASARAPRDGRIDVGLRDLDVRTWGEMMGYVAPGSVSSLPLSGDLIIDGQRGSKVLQIVGKERLGPFRPALDATRRVGPVTLSADHGGSYTGDAMEGLSIALTAEQEGREPGTMALDGRLHLRERTHVALKGKGTGVDLSPFVALYAGPDTGVSSGLDPSRWFDFAVPVDLDLVVDLERCAWFGLPVDEGKLTLRGEGGNLRVNLDAPRIGGGHATVAAHLVASGRNPGFEWTVDAQDTDVGALITALRWGRPTFVTARGSFATAGRGTGVRQAIGRSLDGAFTFDLSKGTFGDAAVLDYLARQTGVVAFRRMGFEVAQGRVLLKGRQIRLDHAMVQNVETKLAAAGVLWDRDSQEWRVNPRVDEATWKAVSAKFGRLPPVGEDGYFSLPLDVVVSGPWTKPKYAVGPRSGLVEEGAGRLLQQVDEQTGLGIGGAVQDILGIGQPAPEPAPQPAPAPVSAPKPGSPARPTADPTKGAAGNRPGE